MFKRFRHLLLILLLVIEASFSVAATITSDKVCVGTGRYYWVEGMPGSTYTWQLDGQTLTPTVEYLDITWAKPGTYTLTVQEHQANCDGELQITVVDVIAPPILEKPLPIVACFSWLLPGISEIKGLNLSGNQAFYDKSQADGGKKITGFLTQSQTVWIYDPGELPGCGDEVSFEVTIYPPPKLVVTPPVPVCKPATVDLTNPDITKGSDENLIFTYWADAAATVTLTNAGSVSETGTYYIKATNAGGCSTTATVQVTILLPPKLEVHNPLPVCEPASVDLSLPSVTQGSDKNLVFSYWLDDAATISLTNYANVIEVGTHTYTIMATVPGGCSVTSTVVVTIHPLPKLVVHDPAPVCEPQTVDLSVSFTPETGVTYSYWRDAATTIPLLNYNMITETGTHTYTILAKNTEGCSVTKSVTVTIYPRPTASVNPSDVICPNATYKVESSDATNYRALLWATTGDGVFDDPVALHPTYTPGTNDIAKGSVKLTISAFGIGAGCETATASINIVIVNIEADVVTSTITCFGQNDGVISLENIRNGQPDYKLFIEDGKAISGWVTTTRYGSLGPGTYHIKVGDAKGCERDLGSYKILEPPKLIADVGTYTPTCKGNDGKIYISNPRHAMSELAGVPGTYKYSIEKEGSLEIKWSELLGSTATCTFGDLATGTYTVKIYDSAYMYCVQTIAKVTLFEAQPLLVSATATDVTCFAADDGTISVTTASGGSGNYKYQLIVKSTGNPWSYGWVSAKNLIGTIAPGVYNLQMRDENNAACVYTAPDIYTINEPEMLAGTATSTDEKCWNAKDGTVIVTGGSGGHGNYVYLLEGVPLDPADGTKFSSGWVSSPSFTKLAPGTYDLWIGDAKFKDCFRQIGTFVIQPALKLLAKVEPVAILCFGNTNGELKITDNENGKEPYSYSINGGTTWTSVTTIGGLGAGTYTVTILDANSCRNDLDPVTINEPEKLAADYVQSVSTINGKDVGTVTVTNQEGGTPYAGIDPYKYSIDNGANWQVSSEFTNLTPGTYTVTMADANDCMVSIHVLIRSVGVIVAKFDIQNVTCNGRNDGSITFYDFKGATSGKYELSVNNGLSWVKPTGSNYTFSNLGSGFYDLVIREEGIASSESGLGRRYISQPAAVLASVQMTQAEEGTTKNGVLEVVSASGGSNNFEYRINNGAWQSSSKFTGLSKGSYTIDVRDTKSSLSDCFVSVTGQIFGKGELSARVDYVAPLCYGDKGVFTITASGVQNIEYGWVAASGNTGSPTWGTSNVVSLGDGEYKLYIRNADNHNNVVEVLGSTPSGVWKVDSPKAPLQLLYSDYVPPTCQNNYAVITLYGTGGTGQITGDIGVKKPVVGTTVVYYITDQNGCQANQRFEIKDGVSLNASVATMPSLCFGGTGTITISVPNNGKPPYKFAIRGDGISLSETSTRTVIFDGLISGYTYTCTVTDSEGCKYVEAVNLNPMFPVKLDVTPLSPLCGSTGTVQVIMAASGGAEPYRMDGQLMSGSLTKTIDLSKGTQTFIVTDNSGCTGTATVGPSAPPVLQVVAPAMACADVYASLKVVSPVNPNPARYQFSLDGGALSTVNIFTGLKPKTAYKIKVVDNKTLCSTETNVTTEDLAIPSLAEVSLTQAPTCMNEDGTLTVVKPVGSQFAYKITGRSFLPLGKTQTSTIFTNLKTDTYTINVINTKQGCESRPVVIDVPAIPPSPVISVKGVSPNCYGETFTITVAVPDIVANGKTYNFDGTYTFYYNLNGKFENVTISKGVATITGTLTESEYLKDIRFEANGCTSNGTMTNILINVPAPITLTSAKVTEQALKGTQRGAIELTVTGGEPKLSYLWTSSTFTGTIATTTPNLTNLWNGTYTLTITDKNNCTLKKDFKIPLNNPPIALPDNYLYSCIPLHENLLVNDYDPDPAEQMDFVRIKTTPNVLPKHAKNFKINANGTFDYEVMPGFTGMSDSFEYEIEDKFGQTATATVTITIVADFDGDGIANDIDADADGDGILNVDEVLPGQDWKIADYDNDGHPNWLDIDSDNDGIVDNIEAQPTAGYVEPSGVDKNNNGIDDIYDPAEGGKKIIPVNTDATLYKPDSLPDFLDTDSDNDQVPDYIEGHDDDSDGKPDVIFVGKDIDSDGLDDAYDTVENGCNNFNATGASASLQDFDKDLIRDWRDDNDDDDEFPTRLEDLNADGDFSNDVTGHVGHPEYLWKGRDCELFIPDAFSPNDDNVHDFFEIYCIEVYPNAKMYIFDQQGNKLFEKDHYGNVDFWGSHEKAWWDGTTTNRTANVNGKKVVPGTYYYVLRLGNGEVKKSFVFVSY